MPNKSEVRFNFYRSNIIWFFVNYNYCHTEETVCTQIFNEVLKFEDNFQIGGKICMEHACQRNIFKELTKNHNEGCTVYSCVVR